MGSKVPVTAAPEYYCTEANKCGVILCRVVQEMIVININEVNSRKSSLSVADQMFL